MPPPGGAPLAIVVELIRPGMGRAGVELSVRHAGGPRRGGQAGRFEAEGGRLEIVDDSTPGGRVAYVRHTEAGTEPTPPDTARWRLRWIPPAGARHPIVLHVAANAANDDASEFGDRIYADSVVLAPPGGSGGATSPGAR